MKAYEGMDVFLTLALAEGEWSASRLCRVTPGESAPVPTRQEAGWAPAPVWTWRREFLTPPGRELRPLGRPSRSRSRAQIKRCARIEFSSLGNDVRTSAQKHHTWYLRDLRDATSFCFLEPTLNEVISMIIHFGSFSFYRKLFSLKYLI